MGFKRHKAKECNKKTGNKPVHSHAPKYSWQVAPQQSLLPLSLVLQK